MRKIQLLPAREQIAAELKDAILTNELLPGSELIQERIAASLGVSRMPVREAFQLLERDGFITINASRKAIVKEFSREDIIEHYEIRSLLESDMARKAARNIPDTQVLEDLYRRMCELEVDEINTFLKYNELFHGEVWNLSKGKKGRELIISLWNRIPPILIIHTKEGRAKSHEEHFTILTAIKNRDEEAAKQAMIHHIMRSMEDYLVKLSHK